MSRKPTKPATPYTLHGCMHAADNYATKCAGTIDLPLPLKAGKARYALREYAANLIAQATGLAEQRLAIAKEAMANAQEEIRDARTVLREYLPDPEDPESLPDRIRRTIHAAITGTIDPERIPDHVRDTIPEKSDNPEAVAIIRALINPAVLGAERQPDPAKARMLGDIAEAIHYVDRHTP